MCVRCGSLGYQDLADPAMQVVRQVQEIYMDFFPLSPDLFVLNEPSCMPLEAPSWNHQLFDRICDGLISVLLALKQNPTIVYQKNSMIAQRIAEEIEDRVSTGNNTSDFDLFHFGNNNKSNTALLILDRRDDPVTPLLNHWTYTAMIHENLGITNNRVDVAKVSSSKEVRVFPPTRFVVLTMMQQEVVLNVQDDEFYRTTQHMVFGELGSALKEAVDEFQKHEGSSIASGAGRSKLQSIEDIQRFMENYPEFKRQEGMVAKHVTLTSALSRVTSERNLFDMSELEQELACNENLTEAFNRVETFVEDNNVPLEDKLRLVLLYSLRYQLEGEREVRFLERSLKDCGIDDALLRTVGLLRKYAGVAVRGSDIFNKNTAVGAAKTIVRKQMEGLKGVSNVLMRYEPLLQARLSAIKLAGLNALRENEFKILGQQKTAAVRPQNLIVFMVGGTSYAEARCVAEFNKEQQDRGMQVILGSNTVHNTRSFMHDLVKLHNEALMPDSQQSRT